jgi:hypothetical protein
MISPATSTNCECSPTNAALFQHLTSVVAAHDPLARVLRGAEIAFLVAFIGSLGFYVTQFPFLQLRAQAVSPAGTRHDGAGRLQSCPPGVQLPTDSSSIVDGSSFTAVAWPSTTFSPVPLFQSDDVYFTGPSALVDDYGAPSCFSFAGSQGGAFLIARTTEYHISQFTLNNSVVEPLVDLACHPKEGALWGLFEGTLPEWLENATTSPITDSTIYVLIGNFCFDPERGKIQTFAIEESIVASVAVKFSVFYVEVLSNWGETHTCICRLQLHDNH